MPAFWLDRRYPTGLERHFTVAWWEQRGTAISYRPDIPLETMTLEHFIADAIEVLRRRERDFSGPAPDPQERQFYEAAAQYVADLERRGKSSERAHYALTSIMPEIGNLPLSHIHQRALQDWIDAQRGSRSSGTVERTLQIVSTVLRYAAEVLRDGNRPWLCTAPPRLSAPDWGTRQPTPIGWDEQDRLIAALPGHLVAPVLFAVGTGARQAEVVTLTWAQHRPIDGLPRWSCWWIPPEVRQQSSRTKASERAGRFLVANAAARSVIQAQAGQDARWVFPSPETDSTGASKPLYRINNHGWRTACRATGLAIRVHDLRHTFGMRAADAGIPLDIRRSLLGHEHRDITLHYSRPGLAMLLDESERIVRPTRGLAVVRGVSHSSGG
jgi:integrase